MIFICDAAAKITWIEMGWPHSVRDNRVCSVMYICPRTNILTTRNICLVIQHF